MANSAYMIICEEISYNILLATYAYFFHIATIHRLLSPGSMLK